MFCLRFEYTLCVCVSLSHCSDALDFIKLIDSSCDHHHDCLLLGGEGGMGVWLLRDQCGE